MIIRPRPTFLQLFTILRGSIVPRIAPLIAGLTVYAAAVVIVSRRFGIDFGVYGIAPFTLLGVTLSIFLGFRNSAAYERWWEARKLWGQMVYDIRNLARAATTLIPARSNAVRPFLLESLAFCHLLRGQLRHVDVTTEAASFLADGFDNIARHSNKADAVLRQMGQRIGLLKGAGVIDAMDFRILDERLSTLAALQAGCERIATTPLPFAYTLLLLRSAYIFCLLLPFGLAATFGWWTLLFTAVIAYAFFGLDALSEELEDPFGTEANDLPLDRMCRICEISVFEALGEPAPEPLQAIGYMSS